MIVIISKDRDFADPLAKCLEREVGMPARSILDYEAFILLYGAIRIHAVVLDYVDEKEMFLVFIRLMKKMEPDIQLIGLFSKAPVRDPSLDGSFERKIPQAELSEHIRALIG